MPRVKSNVARLKRKNKVMKLAKGYFGGRSKLWKAAKESVERAQKYAYRDRRRKKGDFRRLWIIRINAAARLHQLSYSRLMNGLRRAGVEINRKVLRSEEHTSELQSRLHLVCRLLLEKKKKKSTSRIVGSRRIMRTLVSGDNPR